MFFLHSSTLLGNVSSEIRGSHWGNQWVHIVLIYSVPFSRLCCNLCTVTTTVYFWPTIVYFCPLSMFWSWWIPMVRPCRFSTYYEETTVHGVTIESHVRYLAGTQLGDIQLWQPSCLPAREPELPADEPAVSVHGACSLKGHDGTNTRVNYTAKRRKSS